MAIAIKDIPTLKGKDAKQFVEKAEKNLNENRNTIDFTKQVEMAKRILEKVKLK
jgi:hypothetical protein